MMEFQPVAVPGFGKGALQAGIAGQVMFAEPPEPPPPELLPLPEPPSPPLPLPPLPIAPEPEVTWVVDPPSPQPQRETRTSKEPTKEVVRLSMLHYAAIVDERKALRSQVHRNKDFRGVVVSRRMPYRDDDHALETKKRELEQERARIEEHKRALAHLAEDEARNQRELAEIELRLSKRKKSLPLLGEIRIASPCNADWNAMTGDEQIRFCDKCSKNVYNISAMTTQQAELLIREKEGKLCIRYYQRADGTVMTADCSVGVRKKRNRKIAFLAAFGAAAGGAFHYADENGFFDGEDETALMGKFDTFDYHSREVSMAQSTMGEYVSPEEFAWAEKADTTAKKDNPAEKPIRVRPATPVVKSTPVKPR